MAWKRKCINSYTGGVCRIELNTPRIECEMEYIISQTAGMHKFDFKKLIMAWEMESTEY